MGVSFRKRCLAVVSIAFALSACGDGTISSSGNDRGLPPEPGDLLNEPGDAPYRPVDAPYEPGDSSGPAGNPASSGNGGEFFASRKSCMAPCGVRFDAQPLAGLTWAEVRDSKFVWDFDEAGAASEGFIAAHMFETPGIYNVSLTVDGTQWATTEMTVTAPSRTVCVSPDSSFDGCPSTSQSDHFTSISAAFGAVESNTHILLEAGKSHGDLVDNGAAGRSGAYLLGAYGSGAKPQVTSDELRPRSGWTFQDLAITSSQPDSYNFTSDATDHVVFHRIDAVGNRRFVSMFADGPTNWMFFENNLTMPEYVMFACCTGLVIKGNSITRTGTYGGPQHGVRIAGTDHALVQDNTFDVQAPHTSLTLRGGEDAGRNGSDWVLVQGNTFDKHTQCHPQNDTSSGIERHVVWEENDYNLDTLGGCSLCAAGAFTGHNQIIRNNIIRGEATGGLYVREHPLIENQGIEFFNNTME